MFTLNCRGRLFVVDKPIIMGIINITPDSFYGESRFPGVKQVLKKAEAMMNEGAFAVDIGGQSTRPGSERLDAEEELKRVIPPIRELQKHLPELLISIDTYHASVAEAAVGAGASLVNDISAGTMDEKMLGLVASLGTPYICMHMQGRPETMQENPYYEDVTQTVIDFFIQKLEDCRNAGIHDVIFDPGFGFGKTREHNFELLSRLGDFRLLNRPILAGLSRKATVYKTLGITPEEAMNGTTVLNTIALLNGVDILRVHDVKEAMEAIRLVEAYHIQKNKVPD